MQQTCLPLDLQTLCHQIEAELDQLPLKRTNRLVPLAQGIRDSIKTDGQAKVLFVCTHNSRRSQLAQVMLQLGSCYFSLPTVSVYSGGTAVTAFNNRMLDALREIGVSPHQISQGINPKYQVSLCDAATSSVYFSKKYDHPVNPQAAFIAVMVCDHADQNCPIIPGAKLRLSLPYIDPKKYDHTAQETSAYDDTVWEIGCEMLWVMRKVSNLTRH